EELTFTRLFNKETSDVTGKDSGIKVLDKMYAIIDTIRDHAKHSGAPGVNEIAKLTGIHPATVHRILKSLQSNGWVIQDRHGKYILGTRFLSFVDSDDTMPALREAAYRSEERRVGTECRCRGRPYAYGMSEV